MSSATRGLLLNEGTECSVAAILIASESTKTCNGSCCGGRAKTAAGVALTSLLVHVCLGGRYT